uniref:Ig-like domain-containing protein n=1 Tax=Echeneis naucrates TaxID=173247 RepID=A0A665W6X3_ECHNA
GDEVVLRPVGVSPPPFTSIEWKDEPNIAIQWDENDDVMYYRHFRGTPSNLIRNHSGVYIPQINGVKGKPVELKIISPVPVPTLSASCDADTCVLKCDGNTAGVEMVTYKWKSDDAELPISSKEYTIEKVISAFSCELKNPVSQETSEPVANPFHTSMCDASSFLVCCGRGNSNDIDTK